MSWYELEPYIAMVFLIIIIGASVWVNLGAPTW